MSVRRATAPDPQVANQLFFSEHDAGQKDSLSQKQQHGVAPIVVSSSSGVGGVVSTSQPSTPSALPHPSPRSTAEREQPASASSASASSPHPLALMTERQQLAFLMRQTSEGDDRATSGSKRRGRRQEEASSSSSEEEESDEEDDNAAAKPNARATSDSEGDAHSSASSSSSSSSSDSEDEDEAAAAAVTMVAPASSSSRRRTAAPSPSPPSSSESHSSTTQVVPAPMKPSRAPQNERDDHLPRLIRLPLDYALWTSERKKLWEKINKDPNAYYYSYLPPGVRAKEVPASAGAAGEGADHSSLHQSAASASAPWSPAEKSAFIYSLQCYPPEGLWGLFSFHVPGRTGRECEAFFRALVKEGLVSGGGIATSASAKRPPRDQPVKFAPRTMELFACESTPYIVVREEDHAHRDLGAAEDATHEKDKRCKELATAIAILSLIPMPGTQGLKPLVRSRATSNVDAQQQAPSTVTAAGSGSKRRARQAQAQAELPAPASVRGDELSSHSSPSAKEKRAPHSASAAAAAARREARASAAAKVLAQRESGIAVASSSPATPGSGSGSGNKRSVAEKLNRAWTPSAAASPPDETTVDSTSADKHQAQRVRAASDALMSCMSDISAEASADARVSAVATGEQDADASMTSSSSVAGAKRKLDTGEPHHPSAAGELRTQAQRKRAATDSGSGGGGGSGSGVRSAAAAARERSAPGFDRRGELFVSHAVGRRSLGTAEPAAIALAAAAAVAPSSSSDEQPERLLPFASFSIPAHSPFLNAAHSRALVASDSLLRRRQLASDIPVALRADYPPARFDQERAGLPLAGEEYPLPSVDERGDLVMHDAPLNSSSSSSNSDVTVSPLCSSELARLDALHRARLRHLSVFHAAQLSRARDLFGVSGGVSSAPLRPRVAETQIGASQAEHSFQGACRRLLSSYLSSSSSSALPVPTLGHSLRARCRTLADAEHELSAIHKAASKELQRERDAGMDASRSRLMIGVLQ